MPAHCYYDTSYSPVCQESLQLTGLCRPLRIILDFGTIYQIFPAVMQLAEGSLFSLYLQRIYLSRSSTKIRRSHFGKPNIRKLARINKKENKKRKRKRNPKSFSQPPPSNLLLPLLTPPRRRTPHSRHLPQLPAIIRHRHRLPRTLNLLDILLLGRFLTLLLRPLGHPS